MKNIKVLWKGEENACVLSNQDDFTALLKAFNGISLQSTDGLKRNYFGFSSVENDQTYSLHTHELPPQQQETVVAGYPPPITPPPSNRPIGLAEDLPPLSSSPPRNGIGRAEFILLRQPVTSLLDLTQQELAKRENTRVVRFPIRCESEDGIEVLKRLEGLLGASLPDGVGLLQEQDTWILIDDAQLAFKASGFWKVTMKDLETVCAKHFHIVIAATYDLKCQGSTPYIFSEYTHISDLKLDPEEAEELYNGYVNKVGNYLCFAKDWIGFKDTLLKLAGGHVGVLTGGISMIHRLHSNEGKKLLEAEALEALRDHRFRVNLARCFPCQKLMQDAQRKVIGQTVLSGPPSQLFHVNINSEQGTTDATATFCGCLS